MDQNINHLSTECISSQKRVYSEIREHIIDLGKAIVAELGMEPSVDTLGRWMAHYIAEQIKIVENNKDAGKTLAEQRCFETILQLWKHRSHYRNGRRPFENFEAIFRTLEGLDPENKKSYYFDELNPEDDKCINLTGKDVKKWMDIAKGIDQIVRIWLEYIFKKAISCATDEKTLEWLKKSSKVERSEEATILARFMTRNIFDTGELTEEAVKQKRIQTIRDRIKQLESFDEFNSNLILILEKELKDMSEENS